MLPGVFREARKVIKENILGRIYYGWWIVTAAFCMMFIGIGTSIYTLGAFAKPLSAEFGWARGEIYVAFLFFSVGMGLMSPLVGHWTDRYGPKKVIFPAAFLMGLSFILLRYLTDSVLHLYSLYFLAGAGAAAVIGVVPVTMVSLWFRRKRGLALGIIYAGGGLGGVFIAPIAAKLISAVGFRDSYAILGISIWAAIFLVSMPLIKRNPQEIGLLPNGERTDSDSGGKSNFQMRMARTRTLSEMALKQARKTLNFWLLCSAVLLTSLSAVSLHQHLIPLLTDKGFSLDGAAAVLSFVAASSILGRVASGYLVDKFTPKYVVIAFYLSLALGVLLFILEENIRMIYLAGFVFGLALGSEFDLMAYMVGEYFGFSSFGEIFSYVYISFLLGSSIGPASVGYIFDLTSSYDLAMILLVICALLAAIAIYLLQSSENNYKAETCVVS